MRRAVRAIVIKDDALLVMHRDKFGEQYHILIGGAIRGQETPEQALIRELKSEAGILTADERLVFIEESGDPYGTQHIYLCTYRGGEVSLAPDSEEAKIHAMGSNLYTPKWMPVKDLPGAAFVTEALKSRIIEGLLQGFPAQPVTF
jgi:ADP-ribose pyrophosphatase YjhB (NUDIX family)